MATSRFASENDLGRAMTQLAQRWVGSSTPPAPPRCQLSPQHRNRGDLRPLPTRVAAKIAHPTPSPIVAPSSPDRSSATAHAALPNRQPRGDVSIDVSDMKPSSSPDRRSSRSRSYPTSMSNATGHSPFEKGEFLSSSLSAVSDAAAMTLVAFRRTAPPADRPRPPAKRAGCGFCVWESPLGRARPLLYSGVIHE